MRQAAVGTRASQLACSMLDVTARAQEQGGSTQIRGLHCPQSDDPFGRDWPHASPPSFISKYVFTAEGRELPDGRLIYLSDSHCAEFLEITHVAILST